MNKTDKPININRHPLLKQCDELVRAIDALPASTPATDLVVKASELQDEIWNYFEAPRYTCWICKNEKVGKPAYDVGSMAGPFKYCFDCWNNRRGWKTGDEIMSEIKRANGM